jgi:hypothetical protein
MVDVTPQEYRNSRTRRGTMRRTRRGTKAPAWERKPAKMNWELVHRKRAFKNETVNNPGSGWAKSLVLLDGLEGFIAPEKPSSVNKLCISIHCRKRDFGYDVRSSLKELKRTVAVNRSTSKVSRIIPGNWGKAESGWLARPLLRRTARFDGGGRIHQFL